MFLREKMYMYKIFFVINRLSDTRNSMTLNTFLRRIGWGSGVLMWSVAFFSRGE